ncbi:MAG: Creatininase family protein [Candidatus Hydrogenedentes bacterium]|nr:Creatininase family protein [Candidatus Hydrogenedentota bacterium]
MEVRMEFMRPREIEAAMAACPTLFLPLGTIEWHGRQNVCGLDAVKAHALCVRAAELGGGIVAPPLFGGIGGLDQPCTFVIEPEESLFSNLLRPWLEALCREAVRQGFKAVIMLTGHYGASQQIAVRETAVRMTRVLDQPILGTAEYWMALPEGYVGDHAAFFETSLMMHLHPDTVKLDELGQAPHQGVHGRDPKQFATADDGKRLAEAIIGRLAKLSAAMPQWDEQTIDAFAAAEGAVVTRQLAMAGRSGQVWAGWRNIGDARIAAYSDLLAEQRFDDIVKLAELL